MLPEAHNHTSEIIAANDERVLVAVGRHSNPEDLLLVCVPLGG